MTFSLQWLFFFVASLLSFAFVLDFINYNDLAKIFQMSWNTFRFYFSCSHANIWADNWNDMTLFCFAILLNNALIDSRILNIWMRYWCKNFVEHRTKDDRLEIQKFWLQVCHSWRLLIEFWAKSQWIARRQFHKVLERNQSCDRQDSYFWSFFWHVFLSKDLYLCAVFCIARSRITKRSNICRLKRELFKVW